MPWHFFLASLEIPYSIYRALSWKINDIFKDVRHTHVPVLSCVSALVHSVDSGLMHGTVNKTPPPTKSTILVLQSDVDN